MLKGIDVSEHNGKIDFAKVKNSGISFVILRLGWIGNKENHTLDKKFLQNYKNAKANGLSIGLYVFNYCTSENSVKSGANWVIKQIINNNLQINKPVFLDMEDDTNQSPLLHTYGKNKLTNISKMFCDTLQLNNIPAGIYANLNWFRNYLDINILKEYKIWLAQWGNSYSKDFKVDLWQYSNNGKVNGINGNVDMNYCLNCKENSSTITGQLSIEEVANAVIRGEFGNGEERKTLLTNAGYNYNEVQAKVNELMGVSSVTYKIKSGDTLSEIAQKFGTTVSKLAQLNNIKNVNLIYAGQTIKIR